MQFSCRKTGQFSDFESISNIILDDGFHEEMHYYHHIPHVPSWKGNSVSVENNKVIQFEYDENLLGNRDTYEEISEEVLNEQYGTILQNATRISYDNMKNWYE